MSHPKLVVEYRSNTSFVYLENECYVYAMFSPLGASFNSVLFIYNSGIITLTVRIAASVCVRTISIYIYIYYIG